MSARNSPARKAQRRALRDERHARQGVQPAHGICRACARRRQLIRPERVCVSCFNTLLGALENLHRIFG